MNIHKRGFRVWLGVYNAPNSRVGYAGDKYDNAISNYLLDRYYKEIDSVMITETLQRAVVMYRDCISCTVRMPAWAQEMLAAVEESHVYGESVTAAQMLELFDDNPSERNMI